MEQSVLHVDPQRAPLGIPQPNHEDWKRLRRIRRIGGATPMEFYRRIAVNPVDWASMAEAARLYDMSPHRLLALIARNWLKHPTELVLIPEDVKVEGHDPRKAAPREKTA